MQKSDFEKAINLAYYYLKFRPRTKHEIVLYLEKRAGKYRFSPDVIPAVVEELERQNYVDDRKFIEMFVKDKTTIRQHGVFLLKRELAGMGIPKELIEEYFSANSVDEDEVAHKALLKKFTTLRQLSEKERFKKAVSYLMRKGFSFDTAKKAYQSVFNT